MNTEERNYEWRSLPSVPDIDVNRDGEVKPLNYKGERRVKAGTVVDIYGNIMSIRMLVCKTFPDIPMRDAPEW